MPNKRMLFYLIFIPIIFSCSNANNEKIKIYFEKTPTLVEEQKLVLTLSDDFSNKNLLAILNNQNWIESFLIKKSLFQPTEIFIVSKEPKYIWQEKFYLDSNLSRFLYSGEYPDLLHLDIPIELIDKWLQFEDRLFSIVTVYNLTIFSVSYTKAEGWYFHTKNNIRINLGSELTSNVYKKLSLTLKYIFEKNLTPSIIDLRYKDGAALNYGK
jgi:cell division septal protein FtsQ